MLLKYKKNFKNQKGFALALALLMLVVMSLMGVTLLIIASNDHRRNADQDSNQQAFYAAETGIQEAKKWIINSSSLMPKSSPNNRLKFCKIGFFPELSNAKAIEDHIGLNTLDNVIKNIDTEERERLSKYSYEYFVTYTPDSSGDTQEKLIASIASSSGTSVVKGTSYKDTTSDSGTRYTIYSCGCSDHYNSCKDGNDIVIKLMSNIILRP